MTVTTLPRLKVLPKTLPLDNAICIELSEGVPVFRASRRVQERIEHLLEKQQESALTPEESHELLQYEELDDLLSLGNRVIRNLLQDSGGANLHVAPA